VVITLLRLLNSFARSNPAQEAIIETGVALDRDNVEHGWFPMSYSLGGQIYQAEEGEKNEKP